jgi:hypothetical protein
LSIGENRWDNEEEIAGVVAALEKNGVTVHTGIMKVAVR